MQPQSTNPPAEHEAPDIYNDFEHLRESGPHEVSTPGISMRHLDDTRYMSFDDPICGEEHEVEVPWKLGTRFEATYSRCPVTGKTLNNTVIKVPPPAGYKEHFRQGYAYPGTTYPDNAPQLPGFDILDAFENGNPSGDESCPLGCIRNHTGNPSDIYHDGPVWSNEGRPDGGMPSKFYFRTQQHYNADPREQYGWLNLEVFDLEFGEWHELSFNMTEVQQLADILQDHLTGKARLKGTSEEVTDV